VVFENHWPPKPPLPCCSGPPLLVFQHTQILCRTSPRCPTLVCTGLSLLLRFPLSLAEQTASSPMVSHILMPPQPIPVLFSNQVLVLARLGVFFSFLLFSPNFRTWPLYLRLSFFRGKILRLWPPRVPHAPWAPGSRVLLTSVSSLSHGNGAGHGG